MDLVAPLLFDTRRYLTDFDPASTGNIFTDVLVIGSGVAGARAAIEAARTASVTLITKSEFKESCTHHAQGGIAVVLAPGDSPDLHYEDTMGVGCGLSDPAAVKLLVREGPRRVEELIAWGLDVDRTNGALSFTREGGHSLNRIIHAHGDQTGAELARTLTLRLHATERIRVFEHCFLIDLLTIDGVCHGAIAYHDRHGHQLIWAKQTILASGGCGQLWRETTNPDVATGDGVAVAFRAGATLCNMEMIQFHPTTLYVAGAGRALISESVRGEGGLLVDANGDRFMQEFHPDAELAPRDVVSRAIRTHLKRTRANCVYLDVSHISGFSDRFPLIVKLCADFGIDVHRDLIPVRPSAHYLVGGVQAALDGSSSVDGLLCCGEVASTGVHGANRMASNSLLEGLVFGAIAGETAAARAADSGHPPTVHHISNRTLPSQRTALNLSDIRNSLKSLMWRNVGMVRQGDRLSETCDILTFWGHYTLDKTFDDVAGWELQNQLSVARLVAASALFRRESIGVHFRGDAPEGAAVAPYLVHTTRTPEGTEPVRAPAPTG